MHFESKNSKPSLFFLLARPPNPTFPNLIATAAPRRLGFRPEPSLPMEKVKRSTPATAPAPAAKAKRSASAGAADTAAEVPAAGASPPVLIEIPSSPDISAGVSPTWGSGSKKKGRKRAAPLVLDDEIEMWTPQQKRRIDEECQILSEDPLAATTKLGPSPAAANDEIAVVAERGKVRARQDSRHGLCFSFLFGW